MKKLLACTLALIMCLSVLNLAASASDTKIAIEAAEGVPGEQVTVSISISGNPGLAYLKLRIAYDKDALTLIAAENTGLLSGTFTTSKTTDTNPYIMQWMAAGNSASDGVIATMTFLVSNTAEPGDYEIGLMVAECYDETLNDVSMNVVAGVLTVEAKQCEHSYGEWITVVEPTQNETGLRERTCVHCGQTEQEVLDALGGVAGDVNGDGRVNARDARALLRYLAGLVEENELNLAAADYNSDGRINARDARAILRYIAGLN